MDTIFIPTPNGTAPLSVTSTTARVLLKGGGDRVVAAYHTLSEVVFLKFGDSSVSATTSAAAGYDIPVPPSVMIRFRVPDGVTYAAGISASGSGTLYLVSGAGG